MFHDFDIIDIVPAKDFTTFFIQIPWGQLWNDDEYVLMLQAMHCEILKCNYIIHFAPPVNTADGVVWDFAEKQTTNIEEIKKLDLSVQSHIYHPVDEYSLFCNIRNGSAELRIRAADFKIFDKQGKEITLDVLKDWATRWWQSIQDLWDEQQKNDPG
jgi:hypothetical protein